MMKWSLKVGRIAGIQVYIHWTFGFIIAYVLSLHFGAGHTLPVAIKGLVLVMTMFGCVLLHELGHALMARRFGIQTRDITMLPIGGVARLERMPREPKQELLVAAAGPAVNVVIALLLGVGIKVFYGGILLSDLLDPQGSFWGQLLLVNVVLVVFNMLPAFPMDGGRILRALLATQIDYTRATTIAARIGQAAAICFAIYGLLNSSFFLVFIGIFVFLGAEAESQSVRMTSTFRGLRVRDAMMTRFKALSADDTLGTAAAELLAGAQHDFPVVAGNGVIGILTRHDLVKGLTERGPASRAGDAMRAGCELINEGESVERAFEILRENKCSSLPVVRNGELVGLITMENITEWIMVNNAVQHPRA